MLLIDGLHGVAFGSSEIGEAHIVLCCCASIYTVTNVQLLSLYSCIPELLTFPMLSWVSEERPSVSFNLVSNPKNSIACYMSAWLVYAIHIKAHRQPELGWMAVLHSS